MITKQLVIEKFIEYNKEYFGNKLETPSFYMLTSKLPYGSCVRKKDRKCNILISRYINDMDFFSSVLIHEMIHQYVYQVLGGFRYTILQHGPLFLITRYILKKKYKIDIC